MTTYFRGPILIAFCILNPGNKSMIATFVHLIPSLYISLPTLVALHHILLHACATLRQHSVTHLACSCSQSVWLWGFVR